MALDHDSLLRLLMTHRTMLISYILTIVRDFHLAEDVFQEVSLLVFKKSDSLRGQELFPAWVRSIARFTALNVLRKQKSAALTLESAVLDGLDESWEASDRDAPSDELEALRECLQKLPPRAQRLVELRYGEDLKGHDLARKFSQSLNTVYVALNRTHEALAKCVEFRLSNRGVV